MPKPTLTTESGAPVVDNQRSQTAGPTGPVLLQDQHLLEKLARFNRERIPERVVHANGSAAYGTFEVTADVTRWTRARFLGEVGKRTETFLRFSTVAGGRGSADAVRDPRGFAVKFYTEDGNYDLVGNNTPIFFIHDPLKFPDFIHSQKPDPFTNHQEPDNVWDFFSHSPEATHMFTWLFGDRGIPASYRHMDGFGSHTYQWVNADGEAVWVKYHFKTDQGIRCLDSSEAAELAGLNPDSHQLDLIEAIERERVPVMDAEGADHARGRGRGLPVQPLRPDQGVAAEGLPADRGRQAARSTGTPTTTSPTSSRRDSIRATSYPASGRPPTRCCRAGCSPTVTPTATDSGSTTPSCRSTPRTPPRPTTTGVTGSWPATGTAARAKNYEPNSYRRPGRDRPALRRPLGAARLDGDL